MWRWGDLRGSTQRIRATQQVGITGCRELKRLRRKDRKSLVVVHEEEETRGDPVWS